MGHVSETLPGLYCYLLFVNSVGLRSRQHAAPRASVMVSGHSWKHDSPGDSRSAELVPFCLSSSNELNGLNPTVDMVSRGILFRDRFSALQDLPHLTRIRHEILDDAASARAIRLVDTDHPSRTDSP